MPSLSIRSLQSRLLASFVVLMVVVQLAGFLLINTVGVAAARRTIGADVAAGARVFERVLDLDAQRMIEGTRFLAADPAFRDAVTTGDSTLLAPALAKQGKRAGAAVMLLVGGEQRVVAGTLDAETGRRFVYSRLLDRASAAQQATAIVPLAGQLYQLVVVPVLAPRPVAWIVAGIRINDALAQELGGITRLQISFLGRHDEGEWQLHASSLPEGDRPGLTRDVAANRFASTDSEGNAEFSADSVSRVLNLAPRADDAAVVVLQAPLSTAMEPLYALQRQLAVISLVGVLAAGFIALWLGRGIAGPLTDFAAAARRIAAGDYSAIPPLSRKDEIGDLAHAFRMLQEGVADSVSRMTNLAYRDALTGLPTRVLFIDRLDQALAAAARAGSPVAVLVIDLDRFGDVNDTLGHAIGDQLLREVAARLRSAIRRATDSVARIGGDEFAILMPGGRPVDAQRVAESVRRALEARMTFDGHVVGIRGSIGIAASPDHGKDSAKLIERADVAMHAAKKDRQGVAVWDDRHDEQSDKRLAMMSDLRKAVDNEELALVYLPKVSLGESGEHAVEALVRWQHPSRGLVPPAEFIPFAERTGYIRTITQWVLARAVAQCVEWRGRGLPMNISVNISGQDLMDSDLPVRLTELLEREGCAAGWITIEIPESAIAAEPGHVLKNLDRLRALGCRLAVDDYGSGVSSVAFLRRLHLNELKIDRSFVTAMASDASNALVVRSTIELAHREGLIVVAEGVEDEATLEQLRAAGCDAVQGFLLGRPLAADDVPDWVRESVWARPAREKTSLRRVR